MKIKGPTKSRNAGEARPAFYRHHKSYPPSFHHDGRKRDAPRFGNIKWVQYKKK
jgi:hypothetical protein